MTPSQIEQLIAKDNIAQAIEALLKFSKERKRKWYEATLMQSGHYEHLKRDKLSGTISNEEASIRSARIKQALLEILRNASSQSPAPAASRRSKSLSFNSLVGLVSICLIGLFVWGYQFFWKPQELQTSAPITVQDSATITAAVPTQPEKKSRNTVNGSNQLTGLGEREKVETQSKAEPKTSLSLLKVTSSNPDFYAVLQQEASRILQEKGIAYTLSSGKSNGSAIEFKFTVNQKEVHSGIRDDAVRYTLSLSVNAIAPAGKTCLSGAYSSDEGLIAYADDGEETVLRKVIMPQLAQIKAQMDLSEVLPCL